MWLQIDVKLIIIRVERFLKELWYINVDIKIFQCVVCPYIIYHAFYPALSPPPNLCFLKSSFRWSNEALALANKVCLHSYQTELEFGVVSSQQNSLGCSMQCSEGPQKS